jgi:hypothetical protein
MDGFINPIIKLERESSTTKFIELLKMTIGTVPLKEMENFENNSTLQRRTRRFIRKLEADHHNKPNRVGYILQDCTIFTRDI